MTTHSIPFDIMQAIIQQQQAQQQAQQPRKPSLFDRISEGGNRLFGLPGQGLLSDEEQQFARSQGLLGLGSSLLRASGPSRDPVSLGQAVGQAIPEAQAAAFQGLQQQDFLQQRRAAQQAAEAKSKALEQATAGETLDFNQVVQGLLKSGQVETAGEIAGIANKLSTEGARLHFMKDDDGTIFALDPFTGEVKNEIGMQIGDEIVTLDQNQQGTVNTVRDDFMATTKPLRDQGNAYSRLTAASGDLKAAIQSGNRQDAAAAANMLITQFVLLGEPDSVVRDPEFRRAATVGGIPQRIESVVEGLFSGTLSVGSLNSIARQSRLQFDAAKNQYEEIFLPPAQQRLVDAGIKKEFLRAPDIFGTVPGETPQRIPSPLVPEGTFDPSFAERLFSGFGVQERGTAGQNALDQLMDQAVEIRRRIAAMRGGDALTPFEPDTSRTNR